MESRCYSQIFNLTVNNFDKPGGPLRVDVVKYI